MAEISKITLPSGTTYDIKDATARAAIAGGTTFLGITTTALTDGATTASIVIDGQTVSAVNGGIAIYNNKEFIFASSDSKWHEIGDTTNLGDLAYKDSASGSFTPSGTVSQPTFTGTASTVTITAADNTNGNYQPKGTVSQPSFSGTSLTSTGKFTPDGSVVVSYTSQTKQATIQKQTTGGYDITPAGTVGKPTFTGTEATISSEATYQPSGSVTLTNTNKTAVVSPAASGTATYTPAGSVAAPTISVGTAGATTTIKNPTSATVTKTVVAAAPGATAPANAITYYNVTGETLSLYQLGYTTGASITTSNVTVKTGDASYTASAPQFTGTGVRLVTDNISVPSSASFTGTEATISSTATYTPAGENSTPSFTGTSHRIYVGVNVPNTFSANFTGTEGDVSVTGTPAGTVSQPTFTGTKAQISGTVTPSGTVSQPTFTGTAGTVTVS